MDNISKLHQRKFKLLDNNNLMDSVNNLIKVKNLPATLDSVTAIMGRDGRTEIVLRLVVNTEKTTTAYLYITEDIFNLDEFEYIDKELGISDNKELRIGNRKISTDDLIKLRALRVVYNVIKNIDNVKGTSGILYIRTRQDGLCTYN